MIASIEAVRRFSVLDILGFILMIVAVVVLIGAVIFGILLVQAMFYSAALEELTGVVVPLRHLIVLSSDHLAQFYDIGGAE